MVISVSYGSVPIGENWTRWSSSQSHRPGMRGHVRHRKHVVVVEVGRDLHHERHPPVRDDLVRTGAHRFEERGELLDGLEVAQARRVGRGDVDDQVVGVRRQQAGALLVVGDRVLLGHDLGLPDVHAQRDASQTGTGTAAEPAACVTGPSKALAHSTDSSSFGGLAVQELPGLINFDKYLSDTADNASPVLDFAGRHQRTLYDRAIGKPTFLWARADASAPAVGALSERELLIESARAHLRTEAKDLRLTTAMIDEAQVMDAQFNGNGPAIVRFRQRVNGLDVYYRSLNVLFDRSYKPVAVSGYFATDYSPTQVAARTFARTPAQSVVDAWGSLGGTLDAAALTLALGRGTRILRLEQPHRLLRIDVAAGDDADLPRKLRHTSLPW